MKEMTYAEGLRLLANDLSKSDNEAYLRRGVSTAYYALFHLLIDEGCKLISNNQHQRVIEIASRSFIHKEMRNVCFCFHGKLIDESTKMVKDERYTDLINPVPFEIEFIAKSFCDLQESREIADYHKYDNQLFNFKQYLQQNQVTGSSRSKYNFFLVGEYNLFRQMNTSFEYWKKLNDENPAQLATFISLLLLNPISYKMSSLEKK
jgi:uncharacterized protein (UPF0332 family)